MALTYSQKHVLGTRAPNFDLKGVDGKNYTPASFSYADALVVVFMCNHCPYVKAIQDRLVDLGHEVLKRNTAMVGINSNDTWKYPDDDFKNMQTIARKMKYPFPYLIDETQEVAKTYGAVCTPDFFVYKKENSEFVLRYQGRLDDSWQDSSKVTRHELLDALDTFLSGKAIHEDSMKPSMGCSIKWRA